jgi:hypothetical protein
MGDTAFKSDKNLWIGQRGGLSHSLLVVVAAYTKNGYAGNML